MLKKRLKLKKDILAISGKKLLSRNTEVIAKTLEDLSRQATSKHPLKVRLKETFVANDFAALIARSRHHREICKKTQIGNVMKNIGDTQIPAVVAEEYHFMKMRDSNTYNHSLSTALITGSIAMQFYDDQKKITAMTASSFVHDIGKTRVAARLVNQPSPLTNVEFSMIQEHTLYGAVLCAYYFGDPYAESVRVALQHHEKKNGTGYPQKIKLENTAVGVIAAVDIFDALISERPYRSSAFDARGALDMLCQAVEAGEFDENEPKMLLSVLRKHPADIREMQYSKQYRGTAPQINHYGIRQKKYSS